MLADNHVAVLEAKTQFQSFQNRRPIISDRSLAQMVCEGLATRLFKETGDTQQSIIVIHATQRYVCFLQMDMSDDYMQDFDSPTPTHMLYVSSTHWFDLSQRSGRENALANLCGMMYRAISEQ